MKATFLRWGASYTVMEYITGKMMRLASAAFVLSILTGAHAFAQPVWDSSGDSMLNGTYYFREVAWVASASNGGTLSEAVTLYGTVTFNGTGTYNITNASYVDASSGTITPGQSISGTYSIGAGGFGFLSHPLQSGSVIRGMVSNGIFIGSCTEAGSFNDLFIAGLIPSPTPGLSSFNGTYSMVYTNYDPSYQSNLYFEDAQFTLSPNGAGSLGTVSLHGYYAANGTTVTGQQSSNIKYTASSGAMVLTFPNANNNTLSLVNGQQYLYQSPDGNFVFGGSPGGFDMLVGVRTTSGGAPQLMSSPLYYNAGVYSDATNLANGSLDLNTYYGSFNVVNGVQILHSRIFSASNGTYSSITTGSVPTTAGATYNDPSTDYTIGNGGNVRIGWGQPPYLGIDIALAAPSFSGPGVYLNPIGVLNAASYAPFTSGLSPGEVINLYGTNLAPAGSPTPARTTTLPNKLNGVQVLIDGVAAPLYSVSSTQITAIVPYAASQYGIATIQVKNNGSASNTVSEVMALTTPGVFTSPANGISDAAAEHLNGSLVTESNPAQPGETISVYLTGLGGVYPPLQDGVPSDPNNPNTTSNTIAATVSGSTATVLYAGLSGYPGLYQLNLTIPTGLTTGDTFLNIEGPDSFSSEALIPIGSGTGVNAVPARPEIQNGQAQKPAHHRQPRPLQKSVVPNSIQP